MRLIVSFLLIVITVFPHVNCRQAELNELPTSETTAISAGDPSFNTELLSIIISGSGGNFQPIGEEQVEIPSYDPPVVENGILSFSSIEDMELYQDALNIALTYWDYSEESPDYEYPEELNHLGDEPLNAIDQAWGFNSLRYQYEINDYNDLFWEDTASIYIDDDDFQNILNLQHEVKIADVFYKYLSSEVYAEISNNNFEALEIVREKGL